MAANSFFEHLGLICGFLLVAWHDLNVSARNGRIGQSAARSWHTAQGISRNPSQSPLRGHVILPLLRTSLHRVAQVRPNRPAACRMTKAIEDRAGRINANQ